MKLFKSHRPKAAAGAPPPRAATPKPDRQDRRADVVRPKELGGPEGPEPTRYGDWERKGICYDF